MMRLAIVATPAALPDLRPAPGALDGDALRSRLLLPDVGYHVVDLDPAVDLAEQLELLFEQTPLEAGSSALFYASTRVARGEEGDLFLCLDPESPETGDSVRDIATVIRERVPGPVAFVIECRHPKDLADRSRSSTFVTAAKASLRGVVARGLGVELLVAARPLDAEREDRTSPMTRALIEALDDADPMTGLTLAGFFSRARESAALSDVGPSFAHAQVSTPFVLRNGSEQPIVVAPIVDVAAPAEPPAVDAEDPLAAVSIDAEDPDDGISVDLDPLLPTPEPVAVAPEVDTAARLAPLPSQAPPPKPSEAPRAKVSEAPQAKASEAPRVVKVSEAPQAKVSEAPQAKPSEAPRAKVSEAPQAKVSEAPPSKVSEAPRVKVSEAPPPKVSEVPQARASEAAPAPIASVPAPAVGPSKAPPAATFAEHVAEGDALAAVGDHEGALAAYKRALGLLAVSATGERADVHVRVGQVKRRQDKRREAIASFEKALSIVAVHPTALDALLELNLAEGDLRAVQVAEDRILATIADPSERFDRLMQFGARWQDEAADPVRARAAFERAAELRPDDRDVLVRLRGLYEQAGAIEDALVVRRRLAENTPDRRAQAEQYFELGRYLMDELKREEPALALFDQALASDPSMLEPLAVIARFFAERQEWSELERAYRTMLDRSPRIPDAAVRSQVTWELCRLLGTLFRDHLEDPALALDAFEDAVSEKPRELSSRLTAAELARSIGAFDRAAVHLQATAELEPSRVATFHELFDLFQKLRRPDQAYQAACVTMWLDVAESRERFIFEEHRPEGVPKLSRAMRRDGWELLRAHGRDVNLEEVLGAIAPAAIAARLSLLADEGRLPSLDPAARQDPTKTTLSIVRSFAWASHFLGVPPPAIYLHDDASVGLATIIAEEPAALAGGRVLRGRTLSELAFLAGRHLAYHVGGHQLLLYYPSIEELSSCFLAAVKIALPDLPIPAQAEPLVSDLVHRIEPRLDDARREELSRAVSAFEAARVRADIAGWVGAVERCATRAGYLLAGDLEIAAAVLQSDPLGLVSAEDKLADLIGFSVSDEHHALRDDFGIAIQP